jgi:hypothetical protein
MSVETVKYVSRDCWVVLDPIKTVSDRKKPLGRPAQEFLIFKCIEKAILEWQE